MGNTENALKLKEEGNALFAKKKFLLAYEKYTEAIREDEKSAVLYANRAACCLSMKKYLDASSDAKKATELDSTYSKAWGRLGTAYQELGEWSTAIDALRRAISTLPIENLTASEIKLKQQYQATLKEAGRKLKAAQNNTTSVALPKGVKRAGNLPWDRARAMQPELQQLGMAGVASSAWVILGAYNDLSEGFNLMKELKMMPMPNGVPGMGGSLCVLDCITNGIMRDRRVFHIDDPNWIAKYNKQVMFEAQCKEAWTDGGPSLILQEAQARLPTRGWDHVRQALTTTVRAWIMRAFMAGGLTRDHRASVEWYENVLEVLARGRRLWRNVHKDDRGIIFEDTFERGVRVLHLEAFMQAHAAAPGRDSDYPLELLLGHAEDLLKHTRQSQPSTTGDYDPGFISSFYVYPIADALAIKGYYHAQMARHHSNSVDEAKMHLQKSASFYLEAADKFPDDDEQSYWYISTALDQLWADGAPLKVTLPLIARIRAGIPKMKRIWEYSSLALGGRDKAFQSLLWFEDDAREAIRDGKFTEDAQMVPEGKNP